MNTALSHNVNKSTKLPNYNTLSFTSLLFFIYLYVKPFLNGEPFLSELHSPVEWAMHWSALIRMSDHI